MNIIFTRDLNEISVKNDWSWSFPRPLMSSHKTGLLYKKQKAEIQWMKIQMICGCYVLMGGKREEESYKIIYEKHLEHVVICLKIFFVLFDRHQRVINVRIITCSYTFFKTFEIKFNFFNSCELSMITAFFFFFFLD